MSNAIQFLASVAERPAYKSLFEDPATLANICENVIVPNIQFRSKLVDMKFLIFMSPPLKGWGTYCFGVDPVGVGGVAFCLHDIT